jgi:hypothetical protein
MDSSAEKINAIGSVLCGLLERHPRPYSELTGAQAIDGLRGHR